VVKAGMVIGEFSLSASSVWHENRAPVFRRPGVLPEPYRREAAPPRPDQYPTEVDFDELEHLLRQQAHGDGGCSREVIDAAEEALGIRLPPELRLLHRVIGDGWWGDGDMGFGLVALDDEIHRRPRWYWGSWDDHALAAGRTTPDSHVQALSDPYGWIVFGRSDAWTIALDMLPGPAGTVGQVIAYNDADGDHPFGAEVWADSLAAFLRIDPADPSTHPTMRGTFSTTALPLYGQIDIFTDHTVDDIAGPELEVAWIMPDDGVRYSLAPLAGLPRLRTLVAKPGSVTNLETVASLDALEYLKLGTDEWRQIVDTDVVPPNLLAAGVAPCGENTTAHREIRKQLRDLWDELPTVA
jgi:cell wall assembly regulator SMI1